MDIDQIPLIGGHPVLDFVNSWEDPGGLNEVNYLATYGALVQWAARVGLIARDDVAPLLRKAARNAGAAEAAWREAMTLRRHLLAVLHADSQGGMAPLSDLDAISRAVRKAMAQRVLAQSPKHRVGWQWRDDGDLDIIAMKLAIGAAELLDAPEDHQHVKSCANGTCGWVFLDRTGRRRWCRMNVCGTASKVRRFRERQKASVRSKRKSR